MVNRGDFAKRTTVDQEGVPLPPRANRHHPRASAASAVPPELVHSAFTGWALYKIGQLQILKLRQYAKDASPTVSKRVMMPAAAHSHDYSSRLMRRKFALSALVSALPKWSAALGFCRDNESRR